MGLIIASLAPAEIVEKLNEEINAGLADPKIRARLADLGGTPAVGSPAEFGKFIMNREVGQGDQVRGHQAGVTLRYSVTPVPRMAGARLRGRL
jgi:tripartite-type tricarboxylate transporter receptor subunit TctC